MSDVPVEIQEWISYMLATGQSAATIKVRTQTVLSLTRGSGNSTPLQLQRRDVLAFLARPIKPWSKVTYWRALRAWDSWLQEFGYAEISLLKGIPCPRVPQPVARPIDDESICMLLASRLSPRARAYIMLALYEALRVHEVAQIRGEHFDHAARWLTVTGKGGITKPIPIHPEISRLAELYPEQGFWFPSNVDPMHHVHPRAVSQTIGAALLAAGIQATAHQLRDTAATRIQREGRDLRLTQNFLRHASVATTQKYVAVADRDLQAASAAMRWEAA